MYAYRASATREVLWTKPRNYRLNRNGNSAKLESLASALNGIAASVRCVSSMTVVLNWPISCGTRKHKKTMRNKETRQK